MSRWIKAVGCTLLLALGGLGTGCVGTDDDTEIDSVSDAVELGGGATVETTDDAADDEEGVVVRFDRDISESGTVEKPGVKEAEPVPEPWHPRSPDTHANSGSSGEEDAHLNAI